MDSQHHTLHIYIRSFTRMSVHIEGERGTKKTGEWRQVGSSELKRSTSGIWGGVNGDNTAGGKMALIYYRPDRKVASCYTLVLADINRGRILLINTILNFNQQFDVGKKVFSQRREDE